MMQRKNTLIQKGLIVYAYMKINTTSWKNSGIFSGTLQVLALLLDKNFVLS